MSLYIVTVEVIEIAQMKKTCLYIPAKIVRRAVRLSVRLSVESLIEFETSYHWKSKLSYIEQFDV